MTECATKTAYVNDDNQQRDCHLSQQVLLHSSEYVMALYKFVVLNHSQYIYIYISKTRRWCMNTI